MYWSEQTNAVIPLSQDIADHHDRLGGAGGALGFPVGHRIPAADSVFGTKGTFQRFEGSSDYPHDIVSHWTEREGVGGCTVYVSRHGVHAVGAAIGALYERMHGTGSWLGFPTSGEIDARDTPDAPWCCYATFEGGAIYWKQPFGAVAVSRTVADLLSSDAGLARQLGFPTAAEQSITPGEHERVQFFEHGVVTTRNAVAEAWLRPAPAASGAVRPQRSLPDTVYLINRACGLALTVEEDSKPGLLVQARAFNGSPFQRWILRTTDRHSVVTLLSAASGLALDVGGKNRGGKDLCLQAESGRAGQLWQITPDPGGTYSIRNLADGGAYLSLNERAEAGWRPWFKPEAETDGQRWELRDPR